MRFFLGKSLILREYSPSRVSLFLLISSASIGGIIQLVVQITSMYTILMGYCMAGQVRTMMSSAMYKNKLIMGEKSLGGSPWCLLRFFFVTTWGILEALLYLEVVGLESMALGVHFDNFGILRYPVLGLIVSMVVDVELVYEGLYITVVLDVQKSGLEFLSEGWNIFDISLYCMLSAYSTDWRSTGLITVIFFLVSYPPPFSR